jgi:hypothetical protein
MSELTPTPDAVLERPERIRGYTYRTAQAARSPLTMEDLDHLKAAVGLTAEDEAALADAAEILADQADDMVTAWRAQLGAQPWLGGYSGHPDGTSSPEYGAATKSVMLHVTVWTRPYVNTNNW